MTAPHIVDPAGLLGEALAEASPDLMRDLLQTMINALLSADADAVVGAEWGRRSPGRVTQRNGGSGRRRPCNARGAWCEVRGMSSPQPESVRRIGEDPDIFESFYREHLDRVQRFVARRVRDPYLAADLVAEVFLAAVDGARRYDPERGSAAGWLFGVARNVVAAEFRRQAKDREAERRISGRRLLDADSLARIEERIDAERESRDLYDALASLPRRDRVLMELVAVDGLPVAEAAAVLGVKPGTARVRLHRSRARLQSHLRLSAARLQEVLS